MGDRIVARALDIVERLTAAAYSADKRAPLEAANEAVNSLRLLSVDAQEFAATRLEEIGRMAGGWRKSVQRPVYPPRKE